MSDQEQIVEINFDTFSTEEYHEILLLLSVESEITETETNKDFWDHRLYEKTNGNIYLNRVCSEEIRSIIIGRCKDLYNTPEDKNKYTVLYYRSQGGSAINWHDDGSYGAAVSIYLNDDWNREFGGYFIYQRETEKVMTAIQPTRGTSVYTSGGVLHAITPVRYDAPVRESIQVFINE